MVQKTIPVFSAIDLAEVTGKTKQAVHTRIRQWRIHRVCLKFKDNVWKVRTQKFYLPEDYQLVHKSQIVTAD